MQIVDSKPVIRSLGTSDILLEFTFAFCTLTEQFIYVNTGKKSSGDLMTYCTAIVLKPIKLIYISIFNSWLAFYIKILYSIKLTVQPEIDFSQPQQVMDDSDSGFHDVRMASN